MADNRPVQKPAKRVSAVSENQKPDRNRRRVQQQANHDVDDDRNPMVEQELIDVKIFKIRNRRRLVCGFFVVIAVFEGFILRSTARVFF